VASCAFETIATFGPRSLYGDGMFQTGGVRLKDRVEAIVIDLFRTLVDPEGVNSDAYNRLDRLAYALDVPRGHWQSGVAEVANSEFDPGFPV
jgi:hypothetical protein